MKTDHPYMIGIDVGSTTIKIVVLNHLEEIVYKVYRRHKTVFTKILAEELTTITELFSGVEFSVNITGSAGIGISERLEIPFVQEVVASIRVIENKYPDVKTLIDLGGEDAKMVFFNDSRRPDIRMNGSCAGGTGAFIDQMADLMNISVEKLGERAAEYGKIYPVASRCGVFAKTDVQNLISRNIPIPDVSKSILHTVALQSITSLARGCEIQPTILCIGGPMTFIPELRKSFVEILEINESDLLCPENGEYFPAWGAAVMCKADEKQNLRQLIEKLNLKNDTFQQDALPPLFESAEDYESWTKTRKIKHLKNRQLTGSDDVNCFVGIDSGSTTTKILIMDEDENIIFKFYDSNNGSSLTKVLEGLNRFYNETSESGAKFRFLSSAATGYGEDLIKSALNLDHGIVETVAHLTGAQYVDPKVSFVLDIGGQDMKTIFTNDGVISNIELNEACSSGCGSFLQNFASTMNLSIGEFTKLACYAQYPSDLGSRCTVFMNSKVKQSLRDNASMGDISSGLAYSVVKNCLFKVLKISNLNQLGDNIVVQGGTFRNDAVYRALELLSGKSVSSTDSPELMGALGAALYAKKMWQTNRTQTNFTGQDPLPSMDQIVTKELSCAGCLNKCSILQFRFANGNICYAGNRCEKIFNSKSSKATKGSNAFETKNKILFDRENSETVAKMEIKSGEPRDAAVEAAMKQGESREPVVAKAELKSIESREPAVEVAMKQGESRDEVSGAEMKLETSSGGVVKSRIEIPRDTTATFQNESAKSGIPHDTTAKTRLRIGIPRVLNMFENYPFWHTLLSECGIDVVLSPESTYALYQKGVGSVMSDNICFPAKLAHGHILALIEQGVDRIFYPIIPKEEKELKGSNNSFNCPVVSGYPDVIRSSMDPAERHGIAFDKLVISFSTNDTLKQACFSYLSSIGIEKSSFDRAFKLAMHARDAVKNQLRESQKEILDKAIKDNELIFVVAGRPYHADPLIHQKVGQILSDLGVHAITEDVFRHPESSGFENLKLVSQWSYPNRVVQSAIEVAKLPQNVQLIQLNSFGCGPDSFFMDEINDILKQAGKNLTILRIDEIASPGSIRLRLRSLIESLKAAMPQDKTQDYKGYQTSYTKEDRKKTILAPWFADFLSPFIPAVAELAGYKLVNLPKSSKESAEIGLKYGHSEVCYPSTLILGDIIMALQSGKYDLNDTVVAITQTGGQCRATNYLAQIKSGLQSAGFSNLPVVVISTGKVFQNDQRAFKLPVLKILNTTIYTLLFADALQQMYSTTVSREQNNGDTQKTFDLYIDKGVELVKENNHKKILTLFEQAVEAFNNIPIYQDRNFDRVGVVGEIYVKYNSYGQKRISEWLRGQGVEVATPPIIDFLMQYFVNSEVNSKNGLSRNSTMKNLLNPIAWKYMNVRINEIDKRFSKYRLYHPSESIYTKAEYASEILDLSNQFGEGWALAGEIASYARQGIDKVVCVQPFGCIANHIVAKGIEKRIKKFYPDMNLLYLDIDGGMAEVNLHNRMHFLIDKR